MVCLQTGHICSNTMRCVLWGKKSLVHLRYYIMNPCSERKSIWGSTIYSQRFREMWGPFPSMMSTHEVRTEDRIPVWPKSPTVNEVSRGIAVWLYPLQSTGNLDYWYMLESVEKVRNLSPSSCWYPCIKNVNRLQVVKAVAHCISVRPSKAKHDVRARGLQGTDIKFGK